MELTGFGHVSRSTSTVRLTSDHIEWSKLATMFEESMTAEQRAVMSIHIQKKGRRAKHVYKETLFATSERYSS